MLFSVALVGPTACAQTPSAAIGVSLSGFNYSTDKMSYAKGYRLKNEAAAWPLAAADGLSR